MANEVLEVVGRTARDVILVASGSLLISVKQVGGFETFGSVTSSLGRIGQTAAIGPIDNTIWQLVIGS